MSLAHEAFQLQYRQLRGIRSADVVMPLNYTEHTIGEQRFPVVVLEHVEGETLDDWASEQEPLERLRALARVSGALLTLHEIGMSHGDLFEGNVMVVKSRIVLIDPQPLLWGSVSGSNGSEMRGDCHTFAAMIQLSAGHRALHSPTVGPLHEPRLPPDHRAQCGRLEEARRRSGAQ